MASLIVGFKFILERSSINPVFNEVSVELERYMKGYKMIIVPKEYNDVNLRGFAFKRGLSE